MNKNWWKQSVVYQVYWRSFYDSDGDGYGDLQGLIQKLDYIHELGVDIIWLNPVYESPDLDNGYDISGYEAIMPKAGTMEIWEKLLFEVHARGMKLIMDLVVNHTSDQHSWFLESKSSRDNPKRDWYIWKDAKNGEVPNNWRSYFSPSTWEWDEATEQCYFHSFAVEQPDLNWENPELREEIYRTMTYWLDKGIDGFRLDAIALLAKPEGYPDAENRDDIQYLTNHPGLHAYLREMNERVFRHYDIVTVGETAFVTPEEGLKYVGEHRGELNMLFHFEVCDEMPSWDMLRFKDIQRRWYKGLWGKGSNSQFLNNHDHTRQVTRFGNDGPYRVESAKLLATMLHTLPGIPYIYQGEEIGMTGVKFDSIDHYNDIAMKNRYEEEVGKGRDPQEVLQSLQALSRDNSRTPMQWENTIHAGFTTGTPWINLNPNYAEINVAKDLSDPNSVYRYYQKLIALRKNNEVMVYGQFEELPEWMQNEHLYVYTRTLGDTRWLILLNHSDEKSSIQLSPAYKDFSLKLLLSNYLANDAASNDRIELNPHEARIYEI
ncbi:glycoside hydrolase family 13 protein [Cohnella silvisoli]|uniref:oligo-1,6-glucosidase n=1 Tax=Cohnella silvisoli TaxID=2873699 RepID=A0ABV1KTE5_9BACL|nr:alpha-glucosidase [Cohnella silvisoli]MCD9022892.1 alpha-glucosidase [Cohnella silvisoli]